jgi:hypothetical protein
MAEKNLVEETFIQIQNLENVINENAKEILASTMKEEISELVKESMKDETDEMSDEMKEADEDDEFEMSDEEESDDEDSEEELGMDMDSDDEMDMDSDDEMSMGMDMDSDDEMSMSTDDVMDLRDFDDESVYKIFSKMSSSDEVTVTKDGDYLHVTDEPKDAEYLIQTESEEDELEESWETEMDETEEDELEEVIYELEMDESDEDDDDEEEFEYEMAESEEDDDEEFEFEMDESEENYPTQLPKKGSPIQEKYENNKGKKTIKPKVGSGAKTGSASKFSYKKSKGGFKETMKKANPTKGTGKPKFEFKEGEMDLSKVTKKEMGAMGPKKEMGTMGAKKSETKEAARTYGMGWRKDALPKGARAGSESVREEVETLRTKNEEYRKALNLFRDKLNEVAIFNSNLAYATRLFTEHSTSKQEKINILRRFDSAETLKESKALYKTIKDELSINNVSPITESIEKVIEREPVQSGSAINLIESKTYENPQFLRMKDIMSKIAK